MEWRWCTFLLEHIAIVYSYVLQAQTEYSHMRDTAQHYQTKLSKVILKLSTCKTKTSFNERLIRVDRYKCISISMLILDLYENLYMFCICMLGTDH